MPKLTVSVPKYRKHRASGQAIVTINGRDHYLGVHGSKASRIEYDRLIGQWVASLRDPLFGLPEERAAAQTVAQLINAFRKHCEKRYRHQDGTPTGAIETIKAVMKRLRKLYGDVAASDFRPLSFKHFIQTMIDEDLSRTYINMAISKVKQMFRWAVSEELIDEAVSRRLESVRGESRGSSSARETDGVEPVADEIVEKTIPHMPTMIQAMVKLQRLTGMRPSETCCMKPMELDEHSGVLLYRPGQHKTKHKGKSRVIVIGPQGRLLLAPYLDANESYVFSPIKSIKLEMSRRGVKRSVPKTVGEHYTNDSFRRAIHRACELAFPYPKNATTAEKAEWRKVYWWSPNQLRHSLATEVRAVERDLESVAAVLGHSNVSTSEIYAERNLKLAIEVMQKIG